VHVCGSVGYLNLILNVVFSVAYHSNTSVRPLKIFSGGFFTQTKQKMVIIFFEQQSNFDFKGEKNNIEQCLDLLSSKCKKNHIFVEQITGFFFFQKQLGV
jgi:hypothetical protein